MRFFGPPHSPDVIPSQESLCQQIVNDLLDKAMGKTRIDVVDEFAYPLPVEVICHILGVPIENEPLLRAWVADAMAGIFDLGPEIETEEGQARRAKGIETGQALKKYIIGLVERAERSPCPGMISQLVHDDGPDGPMSPSEIVNNTILLFVAGHDSTVNLISHCVLTVLRNPWSIELLRSRPDQIPGAIEEALRLQSSVQFFPSRSALADIEIAGTTIPKGAPIFLMYGAANRDPRRFPNPNEFDPERKDNEHVGWGRSIHACFGGPLARLEVNTAVEAFLCRVDNPRLVENPPPYRRRRPSPEPGWARVRVPAPRAVRRAAASRRTETLSGKHFLGSDLVEVDEKVPWSAEHLADPLRPSHLGHAQTLRRACVFDPVHARP